MKKRCIIIGASPEADLSFLPRCLHDDDFIVCADGGYHYAEALGIKTHLIIGDFDSLSSSDRELMEQTYGGKDLKTEIITLNPIKDDTDTEAALQLAFSLSEKDIFMLGATGSRLDHTYGNIELLCQGVDSKHKVYIVDKNNRISMISNETVLISKEEQYGKYLSLFPVGGACEGVSVTGTFYPLENKILSGGNTLGVSNEIVSDCAKITVKKGKLLIIESLD